MAVELIRPIANSVTEESTFNVVAIVPAHDHDALGKDEVFQLGRQGFLGCCKPLGFGAIIP